MSAETTYFTGYEKTPRALMAHVTGANAADITQASISAIALWVYDKTDRATPIISNLALTVNAVVFDTLQTGNGWDIDEDGYNFRYVTLAAHMPRPGTFEFELKFTPASGEPFWKVFQGEAKPLVST